MKQTIRLEDQIKKAKKRRFVLPSENLTGRWCCCRPAGRTLSVPAHHAGPKAHLLSPPHVPPLSQSPWSQHLLLQDPATPTW